VTVLEFDQTTSQNLSFIQMHNQKHKNTESKLDLKKEAINAAN